VAQLRAYPIVSSRHGVSSSIQETTLALMPNGENDRGIALYLVFV
jgi:hypothetical protein